MAEEKGFDWGVFHDGNITNLSISGGSLLIQVEIEYLAKRMAPPTAFFTIKANQFRRIQYEVYGGGTLTDPTVIQKFEPEILYINSEGDTRILECHEGLLTIEYSGEEIFDSQNRAISPETIYAVAQKYWDDFKDGKLGSARKNNENEKRSRE